MKHVYLMIGGNLGDKLMNIKQCIQKLSLHFEKIIYQSNIYETEAWGSDYPQPNHLNQIIVFTTNKNPNDILEILIKIETEFGRIRKDKNGPRIIDIDILFIDQEIVLSKELIVPQKHIEERNFVLIPMNEINPNFIHPLIGKTINELLNNCKDSKKVWLYKENH